MLIAKDSAVAWVLPKIRIICSGIRPNHLKVIMLARQCYRSLWAVKKELLQSGAALSSFIQHGKGAQVKEPCMQQVRSYRRPAFGIMGQRTCENRFLTVKPELTCAIQTRGKIKKAQKQKGKTDAKKMEGLDEVFDVEEYEALLEKNLTELREEFINNLSVQASTEQFEKLQVKTSSGTFPLNNLATVIQKSPSLIIIDLKRSPQYMNDVTETLKKSQTSLNPQQSSPTSLAISLPKVSRERREQLAKSAKTLLTARKVKINKVFDDYTKIVQKTSAQKEDKKHANEALLQMKRNAETKAEEMMKAKQQELLKG